MENEMKNLNARTIIGIILVLIGISFLADNIFFLPFYFSHYIFSVPFLLVVIGLIMLLNSKDSHAGFALIFVGAALLIFRFYEVPFREIFRDYWPLILILFGVYILIKPRREKHNKKNEAFEFSNKRTSDSNKNLEDDYINEVAVLSGVDRRIISKNFRGGKITTMFGGADLDFSEAKLAEGRNVITFFGGTDIRVPKDWKIVLSITSIFGGFDDERRSSSSENIDEARVLEIKGVVFFGGGNLKN
jgi:predicted membrane protein